MEHRVNLFPLNPLFALHPFRLAAYFIHDQLGTPAMRRSVPQLPLLSGEVGKIILQVEPGGEP